VIVVSREALNRGGYAVVVPTTSSGVQQRRNLPNTVYFSAGDYGFDRDCVAQAELIAAVEREDMDGNPVGELGGEDFRTLLKAIGYVIQCDCEQL
jgi:mRNA-degrading endonuclease toxin of MazEF toxin-antitoxin module